MAIKIIKHKIEQEKLAYKFLCDCGCEFWSDADGVMEVNSCGHVFLYQTKCPEYGCTVSMVPNLELNIMPRNKIFDE